MPEQLDLLAGFSRPQAEPQTAAMPMPAPPASEPEAKVDQPEDAPKASPTTLLIIDTETSGLDPQQDQCLEVGCILFDVPSRSVLAQQSRAAKLSALSRKLQASAVQPGVSSFG